MLNYYGIDTIWLIICGKKSNRLYNKIKDLLETMIDSYDESNCVSAYNQCRGVLNGIPNELEYLDKDVHGNKELFARYITSNYKGITGKQDSSHSE